MRERVRWLGRYTVAINHTLLIKWHQREEKIGQSTKTSGIRGHTCHQMIKSRPLTNSKETQVAVLKWFIDK
jgi:hypothetical protein